VLTLLAGDVGAPQKSLSFSKNMVQDKDIPALPFDLTLETVGQKCALEQTEKKHFVWPLITFLHKRIKGQISFCLVHPTSECVIISNTFRFHQTFLKNSL
jgi:hypothetical protein